MSLAILFHFLCAQHVSDINISITRSLRLVCWITTLVVLFLVRCVFEFRCGWVGVVSVLQASACNTDTYFLNDFEIVPVAPIITGITFVFTFHMRCISIVKFLYFRIFLASSSFYYYYYFFFLLPSKLSSPPPPLSCSWLSVTSYSTLSSSSSSSSSSSPSSTSSSSSSAAASPSSHHFSRPNHRKTRIPHQHQRHFTSKSRGHLCLTVAMTPPHSDKFKNKNKQRFTSALRTYCHSTLFTQIASVHVCIIPWDSAFPMSDSKK